LGSSAVVQLAGENGPKTMLQSQLISFIIPLKFGNHGNHKFAILGNMIRLLKYHYNEFASSIMFMTIFFLRIHHRCRLNQHLDLPRRSCRLQRRTKRTDPVLALLQDLFHTSDDLGKL
jgi:hypothetical protein